MREVAAAAVLAAMVACPATVLGQTKKPIGAAVPFKAQAFDLRDVTLLDGPFKHAMNVDVAYLVSLPPDRLLHNFRTNAGLPSTAQPLGGWEAPDCEVRGHFVGHYLTACAMAYRATGNARVKANADAVVAGMASCQATFPSGYLSAFPEEFFDRLEALKPVWVPWYTLHKVYQGLLDMHTLTGNVQALDVLKKAAAWAKARTDKLSDEQLQKALNTEHGGINEAFANLYAATGDKQYLALSQRLNHHAVLDPLMRGEDKLTGLHANTQFPKVIGMARQYELTGQAPLRAGAEFFWNTVTRERSYVIGGNSDFEGFSPKEQLSKHIGPSSTETCNTYNMLKLTRHVFSWNAAAEQADYYERALINHILASQDPKTGMMAYYVPLKTGTARGQYASMPFSEPTNSFWCCTGTGVENHVKYGDSIYWHDGSKSLFVNLFIASELTWPGRGVTVRQTTRFPEEGSTKLTFSCRKPATVALHIRHPYWAKSGFAVTVNGKRFVDSSAAGSYATIRRTWKTGDVVDVTMPMTLRTEAFRDDPNKVALMYGPVVLCGITDPGNTHAYILGDLTSALASLRPADDEAMAFVAPGASFRRALTGSHGPVRFRAFYRETEKPTAVYWDVLDGPAYERFRAEYEAAAAREKELAALTVDSVKIGDDESEKAHKLDGLNTGSGPYADRHWRHATDGGWFSFDLAVEPDVAQQLLATYWGSDTGGRTFDVMINGVKAATETLDNRAPGKFVDVAYDLPADAGAKGTITVRFQARPGNFAGGVFGLRVVRKAK